ncbi:hypothetical protein J6590_036699 [Homalodisca vitripennis]|nr:hypothetical protein J6590_036699 [Homalodisca vitripennis]
MSRLLRHDGLLIEQVHEHQNRRRCIVTEKRHSLSSHLRHPLSSSQVRKTSTFQDLLQLPRRSCLRKTSILPAPSAVISHKPMDFRPGALCARPSESGATSSPASRH